MSLEHFDIIEVFLKKDLDIPLTKKEEEWFNSMDDETKKSVFELVNNFSYLEELLKVMDKIKEKSITLSTEEQQYIETKCKLKKKKLEESNSKQSQKSFKI